MEKENRITAIEYFYTSLEHCKRNRRSGGNSQQLQTAGFGIFLNREFRQCIKIPRPVCCFERYLIAAPKPEIKQPAKAWEPEIDKQMRQLKTYRQALLIGSIAIVVLIILVFIRKRK